MISSQGRKVRVRLYARGGAVGLARIQENGEPLFVELARVRTHRIRDKNGAYRWYNDYALPEEEGPGEITVRLHGTGEDQVSRPQPTRERGPSPRRSGLRTRVASCRPGSRSTSPARLQSRSTAAISPQL